MKYHFGDVSLDPDRYELTREGRAIRAEPQVIELLILLLENRDRMVSKEEIHDAIWKTKVVTEAALSSRIKMLRSLLGDDGRKQGIIRTVHKKGFRFVAEVSVDEDVTIPSRAPEPMIAIPDPTARPAIAIMPFENLSNDSDQEYFADGMTTDLISHLSKHRWLDVVARNTTFGLKGKAVDARELRQTLGVDYLVEGSIRRSAERIRITAQLIDAATGHQKWSDRYDRELTDIFDLQDEITETIAARLEPEIGLAERNKILHQRPSNLKAWDYYHLGIHHFFRFTGDDNVEAQRLLKLSQQLDNGFGDAYAWWAYAVILGMVYWNTEPTQELLDQALEACNHALKLDAQNATFFALRARVLLARQEYGGAIKENEMAIALNPTFAAAHCGLGDSLAYEGRYDEALICFEKAVALSPNDPQLWAFLTYGALALLFKQDFQRALEWTERASSIPNCQYWAQSHKIVALAYLGKIEEAEVAALRIRKTVPQFTLDFVKDKLFYLKMSEQVDLYLEGLTKAGVPAT